jgi:hypothetical protein
MSEPIANDWKAIHDRMQQIQAERSPSVGPCRQCGGRRPRLDAQSLCNFRDSRLRSLP